jgi:hypothetical protein
MIQPKPRDDLSKGQDEIESRKMRRREGMNKSTTRDLSGSI